MSRWQRTEVLLSHDDRLLRLQVNFLAGYPAVTRRAPENCDPGAEDEAEILSGMYDDDGRPVPDDVLAEIETEDLVDAIRRGTHEADACRE